MITSDPFELLMAAAPAVPQEDSELRRAARAGMFHEQRERTRPRGPSVRRTLVSGVAALATVAVVLAVIVELLPHTDSAEATAGQLSAVALQQPMLRASDRQWVVVSYDQKATWTRHVTQQGLDALAAQRIEGLKRTAEGTTGEHTYNADGEIDQKNEALDRDRAEQEIKRLRAGVNVDELPATTIVATQKTSVQGYFRGSGLGGGSVGGKQGEITYASPEQARAAKLLEAAGLGGTWASSKPLEGNELALHAAVSPFAKSVTEKLSTDPSELRKQLADAPARSNAIGEPAAGAESELALKAAAVATSPFATPEQRSAAIRLIGSLDGVSVEQNATDDRRRPGVGFTLDTPSGSLTLIFDREDSALLGMSVQIDDAAAFVGSQKSAQLPVFDSATISASFDPVSVSDTRPDER